MQKEKCRQHNAMEAQKEKCRKRNSTEVQKANCKKRKINSKAHSTNNEFQINQLVNLFKNAIKEGPYYFCVVCNRSLYRKTVKLFNIEAYSPELFNIFTNLESFDNLKYVCHTCDRHLKKGDIPCQAVWNKLQVDDLPHEIKLLNRLEKILIGKRILFKKVAITPRGQQPKIKGTVCNVPVTADVCLLYTSPSPRDS